MYQNSGNQFSYFHLAISFLTDNVCSFFVPKTFKRQEMDSLQRQMEEHTITVHESMSSWTQIEEQLMDFTSTSPATASNQQERPALVETKHNCDVSDKEALAL